MNDRGSSSARDEPGALAVRRTDRDDGVVVLSPVGRLDLVGASRLRRAISKAVVDLPEAIVVVLHEVRVADPLAFTLFLAAARETNQWQVRLGIACSDQTTLRTLRSLGLLGPVVIAATVDEAAAGIGTGPATLRRQLRLLADNAAPAASRAWLRAIADAWGLPPTLADDALLVLAELVTNAVIHSGSADLLAHLSYRAGVLRITVRDSGPMLRLHTGAVTPDAERGRGLTVVQALSRRWGVAPATGRDGKAVWAVLPAG